MTCIIIDDEPNAIDVLKRYVAQLPFLNLRQTFRNPVKAISFLQEEDIDLLFVDINMPNLTGMQLVKSLPKRPMVIFTTAYSDYAVVSYDIDAVDYLVKPIEFERFIKAVNKASELFELKSNQLTATRQRDTEHATDYVLLKSGMLTYKVNIADILFIEKEENYLAFKTTEKKILVRGNITDVFQYVPGELFCRVHKSFVVALKHINTIEVHQVAVGVYKIPVGSLYRDELMHRVSNG